MSEDSFIVYLTISGSGETKLFGIVKSLGEAEELVKNIDERYELWEKAGFPELPYENDPLRFWEGCDVYARNRRTGEEHEILADGF